VVAVAKVAWPQSWPRRAYKILKAVLYWALTAATVYVQKNYHEAYKIQRHLPLQKTAKINECYTHTTFFLRKYAHK
jgi:hypothetical protein